MDRPGTCFILYKKYNIANSSCHFGSYGSTWTGRSPKKYYMDLRSFGPYNIYLVTDRSIYCHMTLSAMNYLLYMLRAWTASFSIRFRNGTCIIILDKQYNIANSSCHFGSYGSIWTGPSPSKYYMPYDPAVP
jgi:hypothetical protein